MPITCESPRESAAPEAPSQFPPQELKTGVPQFAVEIVEVARECSFEAEWSKKDGVFVATVSDVSEDAFEKIVERALNRIAP